MGGLSARPSLAATEIVRTAIRDRIDDYASGRRKSGQSSPVPEIAAIAALEGVEGLILQRLSEAPSHTVTTAPTSAHTVGSPSLTQEDDLPGMLAVAKGVAEQTWPHTMDATVWAAEYVKRYPGADEGDMIGWFANAIMAGYDTACARSAIEPTTDMWWRDASRERPARDRLVIAWTEKYGALLANRDTSNPDFGWSCDGKVLYWMPLPAMPNGANADGSADEGAKDAEAYYRDAGALRPKE